MRPEFSFALSLCPPRLSLCPPAHLSLVDSDEDDDDVITSAPTLAEVSREAAIVDNDCDEGG